MFTRQAGWVPVLTHNPLYGKFFASFIDENPVTSHSVAVLGISAANTFVFLHEERKKQVAALLAVKSVVSAAACDAPLTADFLAHPVAAAAADRSGSSSSGGRGVLSAGLATGVCDSMNSFHVMERLIPSFNIHVSVILSTQNNIMVEGKSARAGSGSGSGGDGDVGGFHNVAEIREGDEIIILSRINKMGKRMVYCSTELYKELDASQVTPELLEREAAVKSVADVDALLAGYYRRCLTSTHIKSILDKQIERGSK